MRQQMTWEKGWENEQGCKTFSTFKAPNRKDVLHFVCGSIEIIHSLVLWNERVLSAIHRIGAPLQYSSSTYMIIYHWLGSPTNLFSSAITSDVDIKTSNDRNLKRDLKAQPQATGLELRQVDPEEYLRRRPRSRPTNTQVQKDTDAQTLSFFYQTFF